MVGGYLITQQGGHFKLTALFLYHCSLFTVKLVFSAEPVNRLVYLIGRHSVKIVTLPFGVVYAAPRTAPARGKNRTLPDVEPHLAGAKPHPKQEPVRIHQQAPFRKISPDVYPAPTATAARNICHTLPLTAHGHCPAKKRARLTSYQTGSWLNKFNEISYISG